MMDGASIACGSHHHSNIKAALDCHGNNHLAGNTTCLVMERTADG